MNLCTVVPQPQLAAGAQAMPITQRLRQHHSTSGVDGQYGIHEWHYTMVSAIHNGFARAKKSPA
jgi:hypothetical protein